MTALNVERIRAYLESVPDAFANKVARAGWIKPDKEEEEGHPEPVNMAYVASIHEFGAPEASIPPRPFMKPAVEQYGDHWVRELEDAVRACLLNPEKFNAEELLGHLAQDMAGRFRENIERLSFVPLRPITLVLRKWAADGRTITGKTVAEAAAAYAANPSIIDGVNATPLQFTGHLRDSVQSDVGPEIT